jgi:CubicO group peptidase (beta-lactamase class C family)
LLDGGMGPTGRVLDATLVAEMSTDQLTDQQRRAARIDDGTPSLGWGLGVAVRHDPAPSGWPGPGSYGWDGGLGSRWLVDPDIGLCAVILATDAVTSPPTIALVSGFVDAVATFVEGETSTARTT